MAATKSAAAGKGAGESKRVSDKMESEERLVKFEGNKTKESEMITLKINLTDPADLMKKLEMVDLTEEETDELLKQAYIVNKKLRAELERQTKAPKGIGKRSSTFIQLSAPASATTSAADMKKVKGVPINQPGTLPPLKTKSGGMARLNGQRGSSRGSTPDHSRHGSKLSHLSPYGPDSAGSSKSAGSKPRREQVKWQNSNSAQKR